MTPEEEFCAKGDHDWKGFGPIESCLDCYDTRPTRIMKTDPEWPGVDALGVEGSMNRRVLELFESCGFDLVGVKDLAHASRVSLIFDEGTHLTTITIEDTEHTEKS